MQIATVLGGTVAEKRWIYAWASGVWQKSGELG